MGIRIHIHYTLLNHLIRWVGCFFLVVSIATFATTETELVMSEMLSLKDAFAQVLIADVQSRSDTVTPQLVEQHLKRESLSYDKEARAFVASLRDDLAEATKAGESKRVLKAIQRQIDRYTA